MTSVQSAPVHTAPRAEAPIRVILQQPALPKYRAPVFRELANRPGIAMTLAYAKAAVIDNVAPDGFNAEFVPMRQKSFLGHPIYWHAAQWQNAKKERTDVLILSWDLHYASLIPTLLRAKANGVPTILWGHGYSKQRAWWRSWPRYRVASLATALLFYNQRAAQTFLDRGWDPNRIFVARNSLDQTPIRNAKQAWSSAPEKLRTFQKENDLADRPVILFVSRLDDQRHVDWLIQAAARLSKIHDRLKLVIIGKGPEEQSLRAMAQHEGLAERVIFTGAVYDEQKLAPWFLSSTLFCFPANVGLSLMHAFGYGLPAVTSDRREGHGPEIEALVDGENGLMFRDGDVQDLTNKLQRIIEDANLRNRLAEGAIRTVTEKFTIEKMVDAMESALRYAAAIRGTN